MRLIVSAFILLCSEASAFQASHGPFRKTPRALRRKGYGRTSAQEPWILTTSSHYFHTQSTASTTNTRTQLWDGYDNNWWDTSTSQRRQKKSRRQTIQFEQEDTNAPLHQTDDRASNDPPHPQQPLSVERNRAMQEDTFLDVNYYVAGTNDRYDVRPPPIEEDSTLIPSSMQNKQRNNRYTKESETFSNKRSTITPRPGSNRQTPILNGNSHQKTFTFQYKSESFQIALDIDPAIRHEYHVNAQRQYLYDSRATPPSNWQEDFYRMFLSHPDDGPIVEQLLEELIRVTNVDDHDMLLEVVVAFVQEAIAYNWDTFHSEQSSTLYPYETLHDQKGVCADKSILLARLLVELGYDCVFFAFDAANHIAVGVRVPRGTDDYQSGYAYIETTSCGPIGRIPTKLVGNVHLDEIPTIHRITNGGRVFERIVRNKQIEKEQELKYGKEYFFLGPEQKQLKRDMVVLEQEIHHLDRTMNNCQSKTNLTEDQFHECQRLVEEHNRRVELYNAMVALFNTLNNNNDRSSSMPKP